MAVLFFPLPALACGMAEQNDFEIDCYEAAFEGLL